MISTIEAFAKTIFLNRYPERSWELVDTSVRETLVEVVKVVRETLGEVVKVAYEREKVRADALCNEVDTLRDQLRREPERWKATVEHNFILAKEIGELRGALKREKARADAAEAEVAMPRIP